MNQTLVSIKKLEVKSHSELFFCEVTGTTVFLKILVINKVPLKMTLATLVIQDMPNISEKFSYWDRLVTLIIYSLC